MRCKAYLDNNATTALDSRVADYMIQDDSFLSPSNPSSVHTLGQRTKSKITKARQIIAEYLHAKPQEILFTSGGTESMNFLIRGLIRSHERPHILSSAIEHSCVEKTLLFLQAEGCQVTFLPVSEVGSLALELIEQHITPSTKLLVFSAANGETGVLQ
ncbi:MAG: aminotransferase class V-fold PLP-dependent enzyme, partial [Chlamydiae bacterium]|nr:aminotransferase class V-fold PLP-dependent enzyme [Chlamydiota bacterium]